MGERDLDRLDGNDVLEDGLDKEFGDGLDAGFEDGFVHGFEDWLDNWVDEETEAALLLRHSLTITLTKP